MLVTQERLFDLQIISAVTGERTSSRSWGWCMNLGRSEAGCRRVIEGAWLSIASGGCVDKETQRVEVLACLEGPRRFEVARCDVSATERAQ